jgi:hypothetical protein
MRDVDTKLSMPPDFDWDALKDDAVQPAMRGNMAMINMATTSPLDLDYVQVLINRLQGGLNRAREVHNED